MIADPTAIPESAEAAAEYRAALEEAWAAGDTDLVLKLANALSSSDFASPDDRAHGAERLGEALEVLGRTEEAIDAFRYAKTLGHPDAQQHLDGLLTGPYTGTVEAGRPPETEAEADRYFALAKAALDSADFERAYELFHAVYESPTNSPAQKGQAAFGMARGLQGLGDHDAAYQYLREASEIGTDALRAGALAALAEYHKADGTEHDGEDVASSLQLDSTEAVEEMSTAAVARYDAGDTGGAQARFEAVLGSTAATEQQKGFAAYYLGVLEWSANNYDVARLHFRQALAGGDLVEGNARHMLKEHWGEEHP